MHQILVLYYSRHGNTRQLARHIGRGIYGRALPHLQAWHSNAVLATSRRLPRVDEGAARSGSPPGRGRGG